MTQILIKILVSLGVIVAVTAIAKKLPSSLGYDKIPALVDVCDITKQISPQALAEIQDK